MKLNPQNIPCFQGPSPIAAHKSEANITTLASISNSRNEKELAKAEGPLSVKLSVNWRLYKY